jgi:hypothetical protein
MSEFSAEEINRIIKEAALGLSPSITTVPALEMRRKLDLEVAELKARGIMPDLLPE